MKITIERKEKAPEVTEFIPGEWYYSKQHDNIVLCTAGNIGSEYFEGVRMEPFMYDETWIKRHFTHFPCEVTIKEL